MSGNYTAVLRDLIDGTLDPKTFSHKDHVGVAYEAIARHDIFEATSLVAAGLRNLAERAGAPEKFNATITMAFMSLVAERMYGGAYATACDFIEDNSDLLEKSVLTPWYSDARLKSDLSRAVPLLPERVLAV